MSKAPSSFEQVLRSAWKQFIGFLVIGAILTYVSSYGNISIPRDLEGTMLATEVTTTSVLMATLTFYYRTFWEEVGQLRVTEVPSVVGYHVSTFALLFGSAVSAFVAVGANFLLLFTMLDLWRILRLSAFLTSLVLLFLFLMYFFGRSIAELQTLREAALLPLPLTINERLEKLKTGLVEFRKQLEEAQTRDKENVQKSEQLIERIKKAQAELSPGKNESVLG